MSRAIVSLGLAAAGLAAAFALETAGCTQEISGAERGKEVFHDPGLSGSDLNVVSCATCHQTEDTPDPNRIDPAYSLYGVVARTRYWGDTIYNLADAVNVCLFTFMRGRNLDETSDDARALYDYLASITPDGAPTDPLPMTVTETIVAIPLGSADAGAVVYKDACQRCHGEVHTGSGNITDPEVILPEYALDSYPDIFPGTPLGLVVIEKIRHGSYFDVGGNMPFYSNEMLSDQQIGDLLAFLGLDSEEP